ncbi:2-phospho-L-lactate guanylyltransferase [Microbulbifer sp. SA54]|uniref:2-phospho-L-lactate guanylyltransferase n=1 Tax=Microbulbifer sp. SA54 TaxID=3401577 RepID=UPI003AAD7AE1
MWALLPLKRANEAKQRLASVLSAEERRELFLAMAGDVLAVLQAHPDIDNVLIVSDDLDATRLAGHYGAERIPEPETGGLNQAVRAGVAELGRRGIREVIVVHGDLPMIEGAELSELIRVSRQQGALGDAAVTGLTLAPDRHHKGTNCLICDPAAELSFHFGTNSFAAHVREAKQCGLELQLVFAPGLSRDIDSPEDLLTLARCEREGVASQSRQYLQASGLLDRLLPSGIARWRNLEQALNRVG